MVIVIPQIYLERELYDEVVRRNTNANITVTQYVNKLVKAALAPERMSEQTNADWTKR